MDMVTHKVMVYINVFSPGIVGSRIFEDGNSRLVITVDT